MHLWKNPFFHDRATSFKLLNIGLLPVLFCMPLSLTRVRLLGRLTELVQKVKKVQ